MADSLSIWVPFLSAMGGGAITIAAQYFTDKRRLKSEMDERRENRAEKILLRRLEIQHRTLIELQDAIQMKTRATGKSHIEDVFAARKGSGWKNNQISVEANTLDFESTNLIAKIGQRVRDEKIRSLAKKFSASCTEVMVAQSENEGEAKLNQSMAILEKLSDAIGSEMRAMDDQILGNFN